MRILIDIVHPADINFYKNAVEELKKEGHKITFTVFNRGRLPEIMLKEYPNYEIIPLGKHKKNFLGKIMTIITREIGFINLFIARKFDVVTCFGFYPGMFSRFFGIKSVHFHDDKEYKKQFLLTRIFATKFVSLCPTKQKRNTKIVENYKELAYLHPKRLKKIKDKSSARMFKQLGIQKERYVYVREVSPISLNYSKNKFFDYEPFFKIARKKGYKIVFDPEKNTKTYDDVILFEGAHTFEEMIAIKKNAALVVTSGDTVLREAALMGVPTIYTSDRNMSINHKLKKSGLYETALNSKSLVKIGEKLLKPSVKKQLTKKAMKEISEYEDMTYIIVREIVLK